MPPPIVAVVPARAALAGNPSDLYGGAVLAVPVRTFTARVEVVDADRTSIDGDADGELLVSAAMARSSSSGPLALRWTTDIPRSVGLAGSSAIVVAVLRALADRAGEPVSELELAERAQAVEVEDVGVAAGLQDRAVQAADAPVLVDVGGGRPTITRLTPARPVRVVVAWLDAAAGDSGEYHRRLRRAAGSATADGMVALATLARRAAEAFTAGDVDGLAELVGEAGRLRSRVAPLSPAHDRLAAAMAAAGLEPNAAGSGGAVVAVVTDGTRLPEVTVAVEKLGVRAVVETYDREV
ncbi:MAG TPA: hypothetical protein VM030_11915 [Acidimicrobiales bacterium]|nr:hypothetical protein [Acidimicrobiales bacterium]